MKADARKIMKTKKGKKNDDENVKTDGRPEKINKIFDSS